MFVVITKSYEIVFIIAVNYLWRLQWFKKKLNKSVLLVELNWIKSLVKRYIENKIRNWAKSFLKVEFKY